MIELLQPDLTLSVEGIADGSVDRGRKLVLREHPVQSCGIGEGQVLCDSPFAERKVPG